MKNIELGKKIWEVIKTDLDFNTWYARHFSDCVDYAAKLFCRGGCKSEIGSTYDVSSTISKDGCAHSFCFAKENFVEFYGEEGYVFLQFLSLLT